MYSSSFTSAYMQPSERVRRQWLAFEQWVESVPRAAMEQQISVTLDDMDAKWNATPTRTRSTKQDHDKSKATFRRELEDGLVTLAREEWQRRLEEAGLKDEDWGEMTFKETLAVERLLGGDLDEEGMAIMERVARADDDAVSPHASGLPALSNATRASNTSGYSFVSPMSLSVADDDDGDAFESIFANEILPSSGPESVVDEIFDTPTSVPWSWRSDSSSYGIWSATTSQSSRQSSQTGSPERPPPKTISADHTFTRFAEPLPSLFQPDTISASSSHRTRAPRYIGPQLTDTDEVSDDEAEFERFKMETRVAKIREFHDEAARADIQLAQDICDARKTSATWRDDEARRIAEHEKRMVELRRAKEEEREGGGKGRSGRREGEAIRQRQQLRSTPMGWGATAAAAAESPRDRLAQEVESKLKLGTFFTPEPIVVVPSAETRRDRRLSQSTISSASQQSPLVRRSVVVPDPDRLLAASVSDLLESLSSTASSTPVSTTSSSTSSSKNATARWIPPPEPVKATVSTAKSGKKKGAAAAAAAAAAADLTSVNTASSTGSTKQQQQGRKAASETSTKPTSTTAEPQLPSLLSPPAASTLFPPAVSKPAAVSSASASNSSKAKAKVNAPATSKGPSPAAAKAQPPAPAKRQSPPSNAQPPPATPVKPPSPPSETPKPPATEKNPATDPDPDPDTDTRGGDANARRELFAHDAGPDAPPADPQVARVGLVLRAAAAAAKKADSATAKAAASAQIEKTSSMPVPAPRLAEPTRARRMSDPVPPMPGSFAFPDGDGGQDAPPGITRKEKGKGKAKRVTIEEVSDDEEGATLERLPVDSKYIFEPKPSVPPTMFSHIIDFEPTPPPASPATTARSSDGASARAGQEGDGKAAKDKHVRWTPSSGSGTGNPTSRASREENDELRAALEALETNVLSPAPPPAGTTTTKKAGQRSRASSLLQTSGTGAAFDRKGKGKERSVPQPEANDDVFAKYLKGATQDLAQMRR
ncbi:hypothetical protein MVEN_01340600 [Mycena venus]|uniref:Uncharacterized protein n=1 Tax=Mycena venus TaxID=2733690 RepID=A0A8H6Y1Q7_9AGAR|nr:hypothetical protein MVEN_01340600 [Mycena venus]